MRCATYWSVVMNCEIGPRMGPVSAVKKPLRAAPRRLRGTKLVRDLQRRHPEVIELVSERFGRLLRGYLNELLADAGAAEDVLQLTLIDVWKRGPSYDPARASLSTWLLMIARSRRSTICAAECRNHTTLTDAELIDRDTEDQADALIERWRIAGLIAALPKQEAMFLRLRFYEGLSQSEIAARTGIPLGTVKMRMVKALDRLRDAIESEESMPAARETSR